MTKALGLLSGGLDSILAVKVLQEQGIDVTGISFVTPFFGAENVKKAARELRIPLIIKDITEAHLAMLLKPKHGYGRGVNPCIDCHTLMLKVAGKVMEEKGFDFIFTGEVAGERPMSQNKQSLYVVAKESGYADFILRPLSAKLLPETKPEKEGRVDRTGLLGLSGRQRKPQLEMAKKYGMNDTPTPAGGCLLTDPGFSRRLKNLLETKDKPIREDIELLKVGRHIRLDKNNKVVVGRNKDDNAKLRNIKNKDYMMLVPLGTRGPYCMIPKKIDKELMEKAIETCASYCSANEGDEILFRPSDEKEKRFKTVFSRSNRPKEFIGMQETIDYRPL